MRNNQLLFAAVTLVGGMLFGFGLMLSQMAHPQKVLAFLNLLGDWDFSLMLVMAGAMMVYASGYWLFAVKKGKPYFCDKFHYPTRVDIDSRLLIGASLFGVGWGIAGICPGPSLVNLISGDTNLYVFVVTMLVGLLIGGSLKFESK